MMKTVVVDTSEKRMQWLISFRTILQRDMKWYLNLNRGNPSEDTEPVDIMNCGVPALSYKLWSALKDDAARESTSLSFLLSSYFSCALTRVRDPFSEQYRMIDAFVELVPKLVPVTQFPADSTHWPDVSALTRRFIDMAAEI